MTPEDHFVERGSHIEMWQDKAQELHLAATAVWHFNSREFQTETDGSLVIPSLPRPALLLMGLSLEALVKGLLIERDNTLIANGKLNKKIKTHDLCKLLSYAQIDVSDSSTVEFLNRLTTIIIWLGKYSIPLSSSDLEKTEVRMFFHNLKDYEKFNDLYKMILYKYDTGSTARKQNGI